MCMMCKDYSGIVGLENELIGNFQQANVAELKGEYIICKNRKVTLPSYHKIAYFIGGTYYPQESGETILPDAI